MNLGFAGSKKATLCNLYSGFNGLKLDPILVDLNFTHCGYAPGISLILILFSGLFPNPICNYLGADLSISKFYI